MDPRVLRPTLWGRPPTPLFADGTAQPWGFSDVPELGLYCYWRFPSYYIHVFTRHLWVVQDSSVRLRAAVWLALARGGVWLRLVAFVNQRGVAQRVSQ